VLLLIFMSLLLVVFLVGDVISRAQRGYGPEDAEIGQAFGEPVMLSQTRAAEVDFELARDLGWRTPQIATDDPRKRNLSMFLLMEEARRAGVRVGREQVREAFGQAGAGEVLAAIRNRTGRSLNSMYDAIARVHATMVLAEYEIGAAVGASLPELEQAYRDQTQNARVSISVIDSNALRAEVAEPTAEELQAHFEAGKDRETGHTETELLYGYRIPNRIRIEYLTVDPDEIQPLVRVSEKQARQYYEENKHKYMKTVEETSPFVPEGAEPQKIPLTYEEVKDRAREDRRKDKAVQEAQRLANKILQAARRPWDMAPLDENNVRTTPASDSLTPFAELQRKFSTEYPVQYKRTELLTESDLIREPGLGRTTAVVGRRRASISTLAFHVEGLATAEPEDEQAVLHLNEPGPLVVERRSLQPGADLVPYQAYIFRVVEVVPSGPPASLDEVREAVVENVTLAKAFELTGEHARALAEAARAEGLTQAVASATELRTLLGERDEPPTTEPVIPPLADRYLKALEPFEPETFRRRPDDIKNVGFAPKLHDEVFALADAAGSDAGAEHRVVVVPITGTRKWVVAELLAVEPIYRGEFEQIRRELERQNSWYQGRLFGGAWFSPENILSRAGFVPAAGYEFEP
jgi:hypothetical protein